MTQNYMRLSRQHISFAHQARAATPVGEARRKMIHAKHITHPAHAAEAQPPIAGADPFGKLLLERWVELLFADRDEQSQIRQLIDQLVRLDPHVTKPCMR